MIPSKVAVVRCPGLLGSDGRPDPAGLNRLFRAGLRMIAPQGVVDDKPGGLFHPRDRVGIKVNTLGGARLSTRPDTSAALASLLAAQGLAQERIIIWDRTNRELRTAGYKLNINRGLRIFGTDTQDVGYGADLVDHLNIGSLFSKIQTELVDSSVSLAILKDHGLAGVTGTMKNYFGAVHNPNKYHDSNCDPYVAEVFDTDAVKLKHRVSILDALTVQFHRGPSYHAQWAESLESMIFSLDPVAADFVGWLVIEDLRAKKGLPSLEEEGRLPAYILTAEKMGLGRASKENIEVLEEEV